jgi:drug/metabolite transporter (DMT)-like permease
MTQSVIIINVIASFIFLHFRYSPFHIAGVSLVAAGITVDIWPMFASDSGSGSSGDYTWIWILLLLLSNVPMAASNVYKEKYLKEAVCILFKGVLLNFVRMKQTIDIYIYIGFRCLVYECLGSLLSIRIWFILFPNDIYSLTSASHLYLAKGTAKLFGKWHEMLYWY